MDPESLQIDFEWACNLEQPHGRFNFGDSCLILDEPASVYTLSEVTRFDRIVPVAGCGGCPGMFAFACRAKLHSINAGDGWCCNPP
jgi:hypothetical protein